MPSILCPVDFSAESLIAVRRATTIAAHSGARLAALHVADALLVHAAESAFHRDVVGHESARAVMHGKLRVESPIVRPRPGPGDPEALRGVA